MRDRPIPSPVGVGCYASSTNFSVRQDIGQYCRILKLVLVLSFRGIIIRKDSLNSAAMYGSESQVASLLLGAWRGSPRQLGTITVRAAPSVAEQSGMPSGIKRI